MRGPAITGSINWEIDCGDDMAKKYHKKQFEKRVTNLERAVLGIIQHLNLPKTSLVIEPADDEGAICEHCEKRKAIIRIIKTGVLLCGICYRAGKF